MEGLIDTALPDKVAVEVLAVLQESLSNLTRHAHAQSCAISLVAAAGSVTLTVQDDGWGIPKEERRSGLNNLAERAEVLGGHLVIQSPESGGTRLIWQVPLPA
ncbi:sensor histidine kinase [Streptomyces sp. NPDC127084]|uniref:sensor histidine kinase n=1 Tax=Streptomyces sp. NPDC127084 TaxID=3347133 RepID=UPI00365B79D6